MELKEFYIPPQSETLTVQNEGVVCASGDNTEWEN